MQARDDVIVQIYNFLRTFAYFLGLFLKFFFILSHFSQEHLRFSYHLLHINNHTSKLPRRFKPTHDSPISANLTKSYNPPATAHENMRKASLIFLSQPFVSHNYRLFLKSSHEMEP